MLTLAWQFCGTAKPPSASFCNLSTWWVETMTHDLQFFMFWTDTSRQFTTVPELYLFVAQHLCFIVFWQGDVCGLCGNFNGNGKDDFTTQGHLPTSNLLEFVDSWKVLSSCPDAKPDYNPCLETPKREKWAKIQCSIIKDLNGPFKVCHSKVQMQRLRSK